MVYNSASEMSSINIFRALSILPIRHLFYLRVLKLFYSNRFNFLSRSRSNYNFRYTQNVTTPSFRTTAYRNSYTILSCRLYNKLPDNIKSIQSLNIFLKQSKAWLLSLDYKELDFLLQLQNQYSSARSVRCFKLYNSDNFFYFPPGPFTFTIVLSFHLSITYP